MCAIKTQDQIFSLHKKIKEAQIQIPYLEKICNIYPDIEHWFSCSEQRFLFRTPDVNSIIDKYDLYEPEAFSFGESYKRIVINPFCEFVIENDVYKILGSVSWEFVGYKLTSDEHNTPLKDWDVKLIKNNLPKSFIQKIDSEIFGSFMGDYRKYWDSFSTKESFIELEIEAKELEDEHNKMV
jgi:hypothetical protein